jgi:hypothetical protein
VVCVFIAPRVKPAIVKNICEKRKKTDDKSLNLMIKTKDRIIMINEIKAIYIAYTGNTITPDPKNKPVDIIIKIKILKIKSLFCFKLNNLSITLKKRARISGVAPQPNNP